MRGIVVDPIVAQVSACEVRTSQQNTTRHTDQANTKAGYLHDGHSPLHQLNGADTRECLSNLFRYAEEIAAPRPELRREYADPAAASDLIDRIEEVDDVETQRHRLRIVRQQKLARDSGIELRVLRHRADIRIAGTQPAAVNHVGAECGSAPSGTVGAGHINEGIEFTGKFH